MKKYLIYLSVALTADALAAVIFFQYIHITWASMAPGVFILGAIIMTPFIAFAQNNTGRSMVRMDNYRYRKSTDGTSSFEVDEAEERRDDNRHAVNLFEYKVFVVFIPIYLIFALFFNNAVKIASALLLPVAIITCGFLSIYRERKEAEKLRTIREKERLEQEMREQTGYWRRK